MSSARVACAVPLLTYFAGDLDMPCDPASGRTSRRRVSTRGNPANHIGFGCSQAGVVACSSALRPSDPHVVQGGWTSPSTASADRCATSGTRAGWLRCSGRRLARLRDHPALPYAGTGRSRTSSRIAWLRPARYLHRPRGHPRGNSSALARPIPLPSLPVTMQTFPAARLSCASVFREGGGLM